MKYPAAVFAFVLLSGVEGWCCGNEMALASEPGPTPHLFAALAAFIAALMHVWCIEDDCNFRRTMHLSAAPCAFALAAILFYQVDALLIMAVAWTWFVFASAAAVSRLGEFFPRSTEEPQPTAAEESTTPLALPVAQGCPALLVTPRRLQDRAAKVIPFPGSAEAPSGLALRKAAAIGLGFVLSMSAASDARACANSMHELSIAESPPTRQGAVAATSSKPQSQVKKPKPILAKKPGQMPSTNKVLVLVAPAPQAGTNMPGTVRLQ